MASDSDQAERKAIGSRIRHARQAKAWQKDLGLRVRADAQLVSNWERGRHLPQLETFHLLARELGVTVGWLLTGEPSPEEAVALAQAEFVEELRRMRAHIEGLERLVARALGVSLDELDDPEAPEAANGH